MRIDSTQLTTITICSESDLCKVQIITGGGSTGMMGLTYGAEESMNKKVMHSISDYCLSNMIDFKVFD